MKNFIVSILCVSVFFIGLGGLIERTGATLKGDERANELMRLARLAIGGEANIKSVQSLSISGTATKTFNFDGVAKSEQGEWQLNLQMPNKFSKMMKVQIQGDGTGEKHDFSDQKVVVVEKNNGDKTFERTVIPGDKVEGVTIVKKSDGDKVLERAQIPNGDIKKVVVDDQLRATLDKVEQNDLFRTTLSLLLTTPQGIDAEYAYAGEGSVDGISCDIIEARGGGTSVKLYLDKSSHLPRMISYMDAKPMMFFKIKKDDASAEKEEETRTFNRKIEAPQQEEFQIKFSDFRSVNGLQLPFKWTQTVGGRADETIDITSYEINPANIADKFNNLPRKIMLRTEKKQ